MTDEKSKPLLRNRGEFVGHVWKGIRTDPAPKEGDAKRHEVKRTVEEEKQGRMTLRRTTIEEIEYRDEEPGLSLIHLSEPTRRM